MTTLVIATRNRHKVQEIQAILGEQFRFLTLRDLPGAPELREDASTFAGNAMLKALQLADWLECAADSSHLLNGGDGGAFVLADDSGLEVDALEGAPGVYSARFAAMDGGNPGNSSDTDNNAKLLRVLAGVDEARRTARFRCVMALTPLRREAAKPLSGEAESPALERPMVCFDGACEGRIAFAPSGQGGFGYDPLFLPSGQQCSFAELGENLKNGMSHRARALAKLAAWFREREMRLSSGARPEFI